MDHTGKLIHKFTKKDNCAEAMGRVDQEKNFCDYANNTLLDYKAKWQHTFTSQEACQDSLK